MAVVTEEKFFAFCEPEPNTGCWLWTRSLNSMGYGKLCGFGDGSSVLAHRWAYENFIGVIPRGLVIDHLCRQPCCVNPDHLEAVTQQENARRGTLSHVIRTGRCRRGHLLMPGRQCRACGREDSRARRRARGLKRKGPAPQMLCGRGHPMSGGNLYIDPRGKRRCRACNALYAQIRRSRHAD